MPPRKKKTTAPIVEPEDLPEEQPAAIEENTFTFKRTHFYAVFTVLAFSAGVLLGYVVWGYNTQPATIVVQAPAAPEPSPTPIPRVYDIEFEGYPSVGPDDAPIVIVEFSDYQCPYCYRWYVQVYDTLMTAYPGKIRFVHRNFPLSFHQNAFGAAEAALCAGDQGAYWKFHDTLFENFAELNDQAGSTLEQSVYNQYAGGIGLNVQDFEKCMTSHKYQQSIMDDINYANNLPPDTNGEAAVGGTPTFFINGYRLGGAYPFEEFKKIIDAELARIN